MTLLIKSVFVGALALCVSGIVATKSLHPRTGPETSPVGGPPLPRLLDLGSDKCIPCKRMQPVLAELREKYKGRLKVEFIDVWKNQDLAKKYKIKAIPTQIFFYPDNNELYRHEGFSSANEIVAKWKELGFKF